MKKKRYDVKGMVEWHPVFRAGRSRLQVSFTGGHLCGGASTPASFETSDPVVQAVIEGSEAFRRGRIRIGLSVDETDRRQPAADKGSAPEPSGGALTVKECKDVMEASDYLCYVKGVPVERAVGYDQCVAEARLLGIDLKIKEEAGR